MFTTYVSAARDALTACWSTHRFLVNALRNEFELDGVPIRLLVRASNNPYTKRKSGGLAGAAGKRGVLTAEDRRRRGESRVSRAKRVR